MSTHEPEITEPVDLALPDGMHLNPAAAGWSRRVLHTANLAGVWGRTKRWDYWAVLAGDLVVSSVYADVDYLGLADVWWCDLNDGTTGGRGITVPFARGIALPDLPATAPLTARSRHLDLAITDDAAGTTRIEATWRERDGRRGELDVSIAVAKRVVARWCSYSRLFARASVTPGPSGVSRPFTRSVVSSARQTAMPSSAAGIPCPTASARKIEMRSLSSCSMWKTSPDTCASGR